MTTLREVVNRFAMNAQGSFSLHQLRQHLHQHYPDKWKDSSVQSHMYASRVNNPKAYIHHPYAKRELYMRTDGTYELYSVSKHGPNTWATPQHYDFESAEAREGYERDRHVLSRSRAANLAARRKSLDGYRCQACDFCLSVEGTYVIEVHHVRPLAEAGGAATTRIQDLISLCPTCHRIAHTRNPPYELDELRSIRDTAGDA